MVDTHLCIISNISSKFEFSLLSCWGEVAFNFNPCSSLEANLRKLNIQCTNRYHKKHILKYPYSGNWDQSYRNKFSWLMFNVFVNKTSHISLIVSLPFSRYPLPFCLPQSGTKLKPNHTTVRKICLICLACQQIYLLKYFVNIL